MKRVLLLLVVALGVMTTSCKKEDSAVTPATPTNKLLGNWEVVYTDSGVEQGVSWNSEDSYVLTFTESDLFAVNDWKYTFGTTTETGSETIKYSYSKTSSTLTLTSESGEVETSTYAFGTVGSNDVLIIDGTTFTKK